MTEFSSCCCWCSKTGFFFSFSQYFLFSLFDSAAHVIFKGTQCSRKLYYSWFIRTLVPTESEMHSGLLHSMQSLLLFVWFYFWSLLVAGSDKKWRQTEGCWVFLHISGAIKECDASRPETQGSMTPYAPKITKKRCIAVSIFVAHTFSHTIDEITLTRWKKRMK